MKHYWELALSLPAKLKLQRLYEDYAREQARALEILKREEARIIENDARTNSDRLRAESDGYATLGTRNDSSDSGSKEQESGGTA